MFYGEVPPTTIIQCHGFKAHMEPLCRRFRPGCTIPSTPETVASRECVCIPWSIASCRYSVSRGVPGMSVEEPTLILGWSLWCSAVSVRHSGAGAKSLEGMPGRRIAWLMEDSRRYITAQTPLAPAGALSIHGFYLSLATKTCSVSPRIDTPARSSLHCSVHPLVHCPTACSIHSASHEAGAANISIASMGVI